MLQWLVKYLRLHRSSQIFTGVVDYFDLDYESEASCPRCSMACQFCLTAWQKVCVLKESLCLNCLNMFEHVWKPLVPSCLILVLSRFLFFFLPQGKDLDPFGARHKQNVSKCRMFAQPRGPLPVASGAHRWKFNHSIVMIVMYRIQIHSNSLFLLKSHDSMTQASGQDSFPISWFSRTCLILKGIFQQVKGKRKTLKFSELHHIHQHILKTATDCYSNVWNSRCPRRFERPPAVRVPRRSCAAQPPAVHDWPCRKGEGHPNTITVSKRFKEIQIKRLNNG